MQAELINISQKLDVIEMSLEDDTVMPKMFFETQLREWQQKVSQCSQELKAMPEEKKDDGMSVPLLMDNEDEKLLSIKKVQEKAALIFKNIEQWLRYCPPTVVVVIEEKKQVRSDQCLEFKKPLPEDVLVLMLGMFTIRERMLMRSVCKAWKKTIIPESLVNESVVLFNRFNHLGFLLIQPQPDSKGRLPTLRDFQQQIGQFLAESDQKVLVVVENKAGEMKLKSCRKKGGFIPAIVLLVAIFAAAMYGVAMLGNYIDNNLQGGKKSGADLGLALFAITILVGGGLLVKESSRYCCCCAEQPRPNDALFRVWSRVSGRQASSELKDSLRHFAALK